MKKKKKHAEENTERWLLTYSDLITLLMIFFVVMYSMSNISASKYKQVAESLKLSMGGGKSVIGSDDTSSIKETVDPEEIQQTDTDDQEKKLSELKSQVDKYLEDSKMSGSVSTAINERGLIVSMNDTLLFDTGKADIKPEFQQKLIEIGEILNQLGNYMRIEGHTDNIPISNNEYSSNWKLSCDRASNVTEFLIKNAEVQPEKLSAIGYGEYRPVGDNSTDEGKAKNRRVDIVILNSKFNAVEQGGTVGGSINK